MHAWVFAWGARCLRSPPLPSPLLSIIAVLMYPLPSPPLCRTSSSPPPLPPQAEGGIVAVLTELRLGPSTDPRAASFSSSESTSPPTSSSEGVRHGLDALEARMGEHSDFLRQCGTWSKLLSHTSITALLQVRGPAVCMGGGVQADVSQGNREGGREEVFCHASITVLLQVSFGTKPGP